MATITVGARVVGQKRPLFADYHVTLPPDSSTSGQVTLRGLIKRIVLLEIETFRQRQIERRLVRVMSPQEIERGAASGKVDAGERDLHQEVADDSAVTSALQAFEDGLYLVFLNDIQLETLDQPVQISHDSRLMFVRLVALAGG